MVCSTPVVFLIFRRPNLTAQVFEAIRQAQPTKLLVVADGPRSEGESVLCQQARAVTENIDWNCEVLRNYSDVNLGCRKRISSGITWAFEQVEEAIILEDDCLPHPSFFPYCEILLEYYRHDERIMVVSGNNVQDGQQQTPYSYYFSRYNHCWGWATWRRAWKHYDGELKKWPSFKASGLLSIIFENPLEQQYWGRIWDTLYTQNKPDTWDYQWTFTCMSNGGLTILPNINLVSNIGFGSDATHTTQKSMLSNIPALDIGEINHPSSILRNCTADAHTSSHYYSGIKPKQYAFSKSKRLLRRFASYFLT
ncbi:MULTISPECIES: glycosyltransferase family 2 protein [Cyanophyceae]|uniref:glycosyltransferase family 2 protein n=1 Tax=Cyanophyceae TaxID=3028117 RepID=UPI001689073C|nr:MULTISPECIES: glycosyltransferase family 2 protein [Cyanophyceae]MBD1916311.1 glycosyltransferase family 2 protein [Phormidium sp. FACHB-77]MBD2032603.1 glycosyltransferase family 2 protein [Phormidium sp. FACHB-322]MBD2049975.1 glycosyltransferase family 2 protein [Leptolyngbya sp. FACHB-60]